MSHRKEKRVQRSTHAFKTAVIAAATLEALCFLAARPAYAQAAAPAATSSLPALGDKPAAAPAETAVEAIVVTGYRASVESALDAKRQSTQLIESIVAEDIGKMPDQNVSESLQRLPGISINRAGGKGTQVLIDGLQNNLVTLNGEILLTGREIYSSGEGSGGGGGIQYSSLEGIPSEEIAGVDVIKNPTARDREGGLGGIVDLKTRSPLAQDPGFNLSASARFAKASDADGGSTPQFTLVGGFKADSHFAITGSLSYEDNKTHDKQFQDQNRNQWLVTNTATVGSYVGSPVAATNTVLPGGQTYIDPQLAYFTDIDNEIKTHGATLGLEYRWDDNFSTSFNWFYIHEAEESFSYSNKAWFSGGSGENNAVGAPASFPGIDPSQPYNIDSHGVITSATMMANGAETSTLYESNRTRANNYQLSTKFKDIAGFHGDFGASYAKANGDYEAAQADVEHGYYGAFGGTGSIQPGAPGCNNGGNNCTTGNHGYSWNWTNGGTSGLPTATYSNNNGYTNVLSNPAYTLFKSNWAWANTVDEKNYALKFNAEKNFDDVIEISTGLRYADREVDYVHGRYLESGAGTLGVGGVGAGTAAGNCCTSASTGTWLYYQDPGYALIPYSTPQTNPGLLMNYNNFATGQIAVKNPYTGGMTNPGTYLNTVWNQAGVPNNTERFFKDPLNSYNVKEKTTSLYLMGDMEDAKSFLHANFGVRLVRTDLTVEGGQTNPNGSTYVGSASWNGVDANDVGFTSTRSYTDILPSVNFVLNETDTQKIRFGAARVVSPQNLNDIGRGLQYGFTRAPDGPGGQVRFKFDGGTAGNAMLDPFRANQFHVAWEDYFDKGGLLSVQYFYKSVGNFVTTANVPTFVNDGVGGSTANVSTLINGGSGKIHGIELTGQYALPMGFGVQANYTFSQSSSSQSDSFDSNLPIPGVAKNSLNLVGYYENLGFSARLAYAWRSTSVNSSGAGSSFSFQDINGNPKVYTIYAAPYGQVDGQLGYDFTKKLGVVLSMVNMGKAKQHTFMQWSNEPFTYDDTGRRIFFGIKGRL